MKYFGIDRVKEPVGTIPSTAWRLITPVRWEEANSEYD